MVYTVSSEQSSMRLGALVASLFPLLALICHLILNSMIKKDRENKVGEIVK